MPRRAFLCRVFLIREKKRVLWDTGIPYYFRNFSFLALSAGKISFFIVPLIFPKGHT